MMFARGETLKAQTTPDATASAATNDSAYVALRVMGKALGRDSLDRVVEVTGRDGEPQPSLWKIVVQDGAGGTREVEVEGGKVTAQRPSPKGPVSREVIHLQDLNLDSSGAFDATDAQARKVHLRFDSVNYVLRAGETTGKTGLDAQLVQSTRRGCGCHASRCERRFHRCHRWTAGIGIGHPRRHPGADASDGVEQPHLGYRDDRQPPA